MFQPDLFKGHRILVTGGGTGLGKAMTGRLLELGADLHICGRRKSVLDETVTELTGRSGGSVKAWEVDIRDATAVDAMIGRIWDDGGPLTGLINNAAGNFCSSFLTSGSSMVWASNVRRQPRPLAGVGCTPGLADSLIRDRRSMCSPILRNMMNTTPTEARSRITS